jgi:uncharacterized protein YciI
MLPFIINRVSIIGSCFKRTSIFLMLFISNAAFCQHTAFDQKLADSLGADSYGMKAYVLAILKTGAAKIDDTKVRDSLFRGHMNNISRLVESGKLTIAGPLQKNDQNYRGIFIFNVKTIAEAKELTKTDPTVTAGIFEIEYFNWYGSAALPVYLPVHKKIEKDKH